MKFKSFPFLITLYTLLLSSCYIEKRVYSSSYFDTFKGISASTLLMKLGAPARETSDENGGKILVYEQSSVSGSSYITPAQRLFGNLYLKESTHYSQNLETQSVDFFVNKNGEVYYWKSNNYPYSYWVRISHKDYKTMDKRPFIKPKD